MASIVFEVAWYIIKNAFAWKKHGCFDLYFSCSSHTSLSMYIPQIFFLTYVWMFYLPVYNFTTTVFDTKLVLDIALKNIGMKQVSVWKYWQYLPLPWLDLKFDHIQNMISRIKTDVNKLRKENSPKFRRKNSQAGSIFLKYV